ncbi:MAG: alginate lyase family protein [Planctomycetota bacterium]|jgi:hypothetical protein
MILWLLATSMSLGADAPAAAPIGPGDEYRINWARASQGASIVESAKIHPATDVRNLVGARSGSGEGKENGTTIFADRVGQRERFVIDLGRERLIGRVFVGSHAPDGRRHPDSVAVRGSRQSPEGPWRTLLADGDMLRQHTFVFDNTPVRFLEVDFGECTDEWGTRVSSFGAFTRYRCPESHEVARWLAALFDREVEELKPFFQAADANRWDEAVSALRDVYAKRVEERPSEASPRSVGITKDMLAHRFQFGVPVHRFPPDVHDIDWAFELDYEWTNSLNRCGYWTHAVNVFLATGDARTAKEIEAQLLHWIESCPLPPKQEGRYQSWQTWDKPAKITWRSLDSAIRLWKLGCLAPIFAAERKHFSDRAFVSLLYSIWEHLDYLSDDDWDGGNWLSTVTSSVLDNTVAFIEFRDGAEWLNYAKRAFETNVLRDVREDGKEIENSTGYVQFAYVSMFNVLKTFTERGVAVNPEVRRRLNLLQDFLAWCACPDLSMPMIGDSDRHQPMLLERTWPFFQREDVRYILTQGREGAKPSIASRYWESSGWAVMRSAWDEEPFEDARHLVFKASPRGPHGHLDQLSVTLYAYGRPLLIDPGRLNYRAEGRIFRSTPYHNTVTVDGGDQRDGDASFERWQSTDAYDLAVGSHQLYPGVTHRRTVLFVKPHLWVVRDDLLSDGDRRFEQRWHFPENADPKGFDGHVAVTRFAEGGNLLLAPVTKIAESSVEDCEIAYRWDERVPAKRWSYVPDGVPMVTLLVPYQGAVAPSVAVLSARITTDCTDLRIDVDNRRWRLVVDDTRCAVEGE